MSGPKKSSYNVGRDRRRAEYEARRATVAAMRAEQAAQRAQRAAQRAEHRNAQIAELIDALHDIVEQSKSLSSDSQNRVREWAENAENYFSGDLREAWRAVNGIRKFVEKKIGEQAHREQKARERAEAEQSRIEEEARRRERATQWIEKVESLAILCPISSMKPSLQQRFDLFVKSITENPDNTNTHQQIDAFVKSTLEAEQKARDARIDHQIVTAAVFEVCGGGGGGANAVTDDAGKTTIQGFINGMPISVHIKPGSDAFEMDTPEKGDCHGMLQALMGGLKHCGVGLGPIHVLRTGQKIGASQATVQSQKMDA